MGTEAFRDADELGTYVETAWTHTIHPGELYGLSSADAMTPQKFLKMSATFTTLVTFAVGLFIYGDTKLVDLTTFGSLVFVQCLLLASIIVVGKAAAAVAGIHVSLKDLYKAFCYSSWWLIIAAPLSVALIHFGQDPAADDWKAASLFVAGAFTSPGFFATVGRGMAAAAHIRGWLRVTAFTIPVCIGAFVFNAWTNISVRGLTDLSSASSTPPLGLNISPSHGSTVGIRSSRAAYSGMAVVEPGGTFDVSINLEKTSPGPAENVYVAVAAPPFVGTAPIPIGVDIQGDARNDFASGSVTLKCPRAAQWLAIRYVSAQYFRRGQLEWPTPFPNGQDGAALLSEKGLFIGKLDSGRDARQVIVLTFRVDANPQLTPIDHP